MAALQFKAEDVPGTVCPYCRHLVQGKMVSCDIRLQAPLNPMFPGHYIAYCIVRCPISSCAKTFYVTLDGQYGQSEGKVFNCTPRAVWPPPAKLLDERIPEDVREDYKQADLSWVMGMNRAGTLMLRRCLENACITAGAAEKSLEKMIDELQGQGRIHPINVVSAHKTRILGNFTAHIIREVTSEELEKALRLTEKILEDLFVVPKLQEEIDTGRPPKN